MKYGKILEASFVNRPNRFIANVMLEDKLETVHVKNTGRCKELLVPGVKVLLEESDNKARKTKYDLVAVYKEKFGLINIDSQAPNRVMHEWLLNQDFTKVVPEYTYGNSRIDFYMENGNKKYLLEVKGCTLEKEGIGYFPDAPTERGLKHIYELIKAKKEGYHASLAFVIQMEGVEVVLPNVEIHEEFGEAMYKAKEAGVEILFFKCKVERDALFILNNNHLSPIL